MIWLDNLFDHKDLSEISLKCLKMFEHNNSISMVFEKLNLLTRDGVS